MARGFRFDLPGEPEQFQNGRGGPRAEFMIDTGVIWFTDGKGWGLGIKAATAKKRVSAQARALAERRSSYLVWMWPYAVAMPFLDDPSLAAAAARYPGVKVPSRSQLESMVRSHYPAYFEEAPGEKPKLHVGDQIRIVKNVDKRIPMGEVFDVTRVTPRVIHTNKWKFPQSDYHDGVFERVAAQASRVSSAIHVASRFLEADTQFISAFGIGEPVWVELQGTKLAGHVRAVTHTNAKVRYAVSCPIASGHTANSDATTLHNLDSVLVTPREGVAVLWSEADNYS